MKEEKKEENWSTDERKFNFRGGVSLQHKIRIVNPGNKSGETFGVTIPFFIANQFDNCLLRIYVSGSKIILESGCRLTPNDIDKTKKNCYYGMRETINKHGEVVLVK